MIPGETPWELDQKLKCTIREANMTLTCSGGGGGMGEDGETGGGVGGGGMCRILCLVKLIALLGETFAISSSPLVEVKSRV